MDQLTKIHPNLHKMILPYITMEMMLDVLDDNGCPESSIYIPLSQHGMTLDTFQAMINILSNKDNPAITVKSHFIKKGKEFIKVKDRLNHVINLAIKKTESHNEVNK